MLKTRVIPILLLQGKGLVKTIKFKKMTYIGDPINAVKIFNDKEVDELIFLDIEATTKNTAIQFELIEKIANECFMPFCYGGGVQKIEDIRQILKLGAEKVAINAMAVQDPDFIVEAAKVFGSQSIVVSIDIKKNIFGKRKIYTHRAKKCHNIDPLEFAKKMEQLGAGELLITSIEREGSMLGYDLPLLEEISKAVTIPVVANGGAGKLDDLLDAVNKSNVSAVGAGSMFVFFGVHRGVLINYPTREKLEKLFN